MRVGDVLCDMHDGLRLPEGVSNVVHRRIRKEGSTAVVAAFLTYAGSRASYTNKYLVVADVCEHSDQVTAVYSYDDRTFGIVFFDIKG